MRPPSLPVLLAAILLSAPPFAAHGATWVLANGDRVSGRLVEETGTGLVIEHPQLGRLTLPRTALRSEAEKAPVPAAPPPATPPVADPAPAPTGGKWTRKVELGFILQDGPKSSRDLNARAQAEGRLAGNSVRATAAFTRSEAGDRITRDRDEAELRVRRDFNRRTFAQVLTNYLSDDVRRVDLSLEQQIGGGYRLLDRPRQKANVGVGAVVQRFEREGYVGQTSLLGSVFQDFAFVLNDRVRLSQESTLQFSDSAPAIARTVPGATRASETPDGTYRLRLNTALQTRMTDRVSLNLRYEYDFDRTIAEAELRADSRLTTSLVYAW